MDFIRGTSLSKKEKAIITLSSTTRSGKISRIVPDVRTITCLHSDTHYVITEYGVADLKGKTLKQRAEALISISNPDFQDELSGYNPF